MSADAPLLAVQNLAKSFGGVEAVRGVSFTVGSGEIVALIGPNGAGKTTCFNMLNGQIAPDGGRVRIGGQETAGKTPPAIWRHGVGRTFQITATFASMSARENVQMGLIQHHGRLWRFIGRTGEAYRDEADALLGQVGLAAQADRPCGELAYGNLKRVELALALSNDPRLLLMDEPTAGMAPGERDAMMALVSRIARERRIGVLFTEHDMGIVFGHADRVLVLDRGLLIAQGSPDAVRADPKVRRVYLGDDAAEGAAP